MKNPIKNINKVFDNRVRLGIMSILMINDSSSFNELKEYLEITDGNLASHLKTLEDNKMVEVRKEFLGKKPNTSYRITYEGKQAFNTHLNALEMLINKSK